MMESQHVAPKAYSVPEAARVTSLGRSKLYELMSSGELEYVKVGKRRLVTAAACEDLLTRNTVRK